MSRFSEEEIRRYGRQMLLREVGGRGQERLREARLCLTGQGEVGRVAATYLRRAGVALAEQGEVPGPVRLRRQGEEAVLLWAACKGALGEVGAGCPCAASEELQHDPNDGEVAFATASLLSLEALKLLLSLPEALTAQSGAPRRLLRLDLREPVALSFRSAAPCACAAS